MRRSASWLCLVLLGCGAQRIAPSAFASDRPLSGEAAGPLVVTREGAVTRTRQIHVGVGGVLLDGQAVAGVGIGGQIQRDDQIVLSADGETPFSNVNEVLSELLARNKLVIGVAVAGAVQQVELGRGYLRPPHEPALLIMIVTTGIGLKAPGGNVAPGCQAPGGGIAIPRTGQVQNYAAASACISRVKAASGVWRYYMAADAQIPFREVDATVSALNSGGGQLVGIRVF